MKLKLLLAQAAMLVGPAAFALPAQPGAVPEEPSTAPQLEFEGTGLGTVRAGKYTRDERQTPGVDFSDTSFSVSAAQRLYSGAIASFGWGQLLLEPDEDGKTRVFQNEAFVDYQSHSIEVLLGKTETPNAHLVDFPTLRDDDLLFFTAPLNTFATGASETDHRFSDQVSFSLNQGLTYYENVHAQRLAVTGEEAGDGGVNAFGASFLRLADPGMEPFDFVPFWGLGFEHLKAQETAEAGINQYLASATFNLHRSVTNRVELRAEVVASRGSDQKTLASARDLYRLDSDAATASVVFTRSPFGAPGFQLALTGSTKKFHDNDRSKTSALALSSSRRLGEGFDLVAQAMAEMADPAVATWLESGSKMRQSLEIGFHFAFEAIINEHLAPRRSLLNQRHNFLSN